MLFWLTFFQSLPSLATLEGSTATAGDPAPTAEPENQPLILAQAAPAINLEDSLAGPLLFAGLAIALVILLLLSVWAYTRVYVITPNNEAFVRTGGVFSKRNTVILNGGCVVLPGFHELTRVPLREISIDVERTGKLAVRTQDYLRADMRVTFFVCINKAEEDVLTAAARLSNQGKITPTDIKNALEKRADDAIRAAAKTKTLAEIDSDKLGFAQEVLNLIEPDLKKVGLTLNNIAISEIEEGDTYDTNNFFDAQGVRLRTETIQRSIQQKREVELVTGVTIQQRELEAEKQSLKISQEKEGARLQQQLQVEAMKAQREREIQEAKEREAATSQRTKILQEKSVEEEEIRRQLAVQQSQIQADITLEEQRKKLKIAQTLQQQEAETAEIARQQAVEAAKLESLATVAEAEKLARIAQEEAAIAIANKKRDGFLAEAEKAKAAASVETATEIEQAERTKRLSVIAAEREAQERSIGDRNIVEIDVFRRRRQAEIAQQSAQLEAEATRILAKAHRDKALLEAEGTQALITAQNAISNANLTAKLIAEIWPELVQRLPEVLAALAPQPGVLGDARIYAFPSGNNDQDLNKILLSTSGLSLINTLLEEGKLGTLLHQVAQLVRSNGGGAAGGASPPLTPEIAAEPQETLISSSGAPEVPPESAQFHLEES